MPVFVGSLSSSVWSKIFRNGYHRVQSAQLFIIKGKFRFMLNSQVFKHYQKNLVKSTYTYKTSEVLTGSIMSV